MPAEAFAPFGCLISAGVTDIWRNYHELNNNAGVGRSRRERNVIALTLSVSGFDVSLLCVLVPSF
jgi:hypothetical protein